MNWKLKPWCRLSYLFRLSKNNNWTDFGMHKWTSDLPCFGLNIWLKNLCWYNKLVHNIKAATQFFIFLDFDSLFTCKLFPILIFTRLLPNYIIEWALSQVKVVVNYKALYLHLVNAASHQLKFNWYSLIILFCYFEDWVVFSGSFAAF